VIGVPRLVGMSHAGLIAALRAPFFPDEPWTTAAVAGILGSPGAFAFLVDDGTDPVGFILARAAGGEGEVLAIGVVETRRRSGFGRSLILKAIAEAEARGAGEMFLEVAEDNPAARELYRHCGFDDVGRRPAYYRRASGARVAAVVMRRGPTLS